jgi:hypothetical protein
VRRAQKEVRDGDRRQRLLEVADFYFTLAWIIPNMPSGYKHNNGVGYGLLCDPKNSFNCAVAGLFGPCAIELAR